jgi:hypothetical protein
MSSRAVTDSLNNIIIESDPQIVFIVFLNQRLPCLSPKLTSFCILTN